MSGVAQLFLNDARRDGGGGVAAGVGGEVLCTVF